MICFMPASTLLCVNIVCNMRLGYIRQWHILLVVVCRSHTWVHCGKDAITERVPLVWFMYCCVSISLKGSIPVIRGKKIKLRGWLAPKSIEKRCDVCVKEHHNLQVPLLLTLSVIKSDIMLKQC